MNLDFTGSTLFLVLLLFAVGLICIIKGGDLFVDAATWIAEASGIPKFIIGATVVSFATTMPEMLVSIFSALEGNADIAIGNAVGSVTANTGLIMCLSLICMECTMPRRQYAVKAVLLLAAIAVLFGFTRDGQLSILESVLILVIFVCFIAESLVSARREQSLEAPEQDARPKTDGRTVALNIGKFVLGAAAIVLGAQLLIDNGTALAQMLGVPDAIIGGGIGYALKTAISQGAKRGLFSNEAGMGSTPHAHALANVKNPHEQGTVAMIGVFIDTFVVLTMTALVVISTLYAGNGPLAHGAVDGISKTNMAQLAFSSVFGETLGNAFVAICLLFFAFSTIVGWNLFGRINVNYLFGKKANLPYSIIALVFIFLGSCLSNDLVWELTDMFNQLMVLPNVIALMALSGLVAVAARKSGDVHERELHK